VSACPPEEGAAPRHRAWPRAGAESTEEAFARILDLARAGIPFAVATVLSVDGSAPRSAGAKMVITPEGGLHGTIGGGVIEAEAIRHGVAACVSGQAVCFEMQLDGAQVGDAPPLCGGAVRVLVDGAAARHGEVYADVSASLSDRRRGVLVTVVEREADTSARCSWIDETRLAHGAADVGLPVFEERVRRCLAEGTACYVEPEPGMSREALLEPIAPDPRLVIVGGGHIGQALAVQGKLLGFRVTVIDDRPEFTDPALFPPSVETRQGGVAYELGAYPVDDDTYIVIVTRGHQHDAAALSACIHSPAPYIGMIGSRRKAAVVRQGFLDSGEATPEEVGRVHCPVGLDIGAETVPEIAVSIAAQLVAVRRGAGPCGGTWEMPR